MLNTNSEYLRPEIMDVLRAFNCENQDFLHYFSGSCGEFLNSIEYNGEFYDYTEKYKCDNEIEYKRLAKRSAKLAFYNVLSKFNGDLPWGALTGIRPTKLAYTEQEEGRNFKELLQKMHVSEPNIQLVSRVLESQRGIYKKGGQDLYISVPFCPTKCEYCSFITAPIEKTEKYVEDYLACLIKEIDSVKPYIKNLRSVYIGGGTPFVLSENQLSRIYAAVIDILTPETEFTVEAGRPDVFTDGKLRISRQYGVTRICVNPQSFNDATLATIGREHTSAQTFEAYAAAKKYGFDINLDLIAGLAYESLNDFEKSLTAAINLNPANITVHTLSLKSGAKLKENVKRLDVAGIAEMVALSRGKLTDAGYEPYYLYRQKYQAGGLENVGWTKPGKACVYNVDTMEEISDNIAVGANAISKRYFGSENRIERYAAPKDLPTYIAKTDKIIEERNQLFNLV